MKEIIYGLYDPRDMSTPEYVGITARGPEVRRLGHVREAVLGDQSPVHVWIRSLIDAGVEVKLVEFEENDPGAGRTERYWIDFCRQINPSLKNVHAGRTRHRHPKAWVTIGLSPAVLPRDGYKLDLIEIQENLFREYTFLRSKMVYDREPSGLNYEELKVVLRYLKDEQLKLEAE